MTEHKIVHNGDDYPLVLIFQGMDDMVFRKGEKLRNTLPYLYYNLLSESNLKLNYIFFKDNAQSYYDGDYDNIENTISTYIKKHKPPYVTSVGQSAGGFAALLIGIRNPTSINRVLTVAPQINLSYYDSGNPLVKHPRITKTKHIPHRNLGELQPFPIKVEYWLPTQGDFDRYHFSFIDETDPNLQVVRFQAGHNIAVGIGKNKFKEKLLIAIQTQ